MAKSRFLTGFLFAFSLAFLVQPASANEQWFEVRSKNFHLVGNASEKEMRRVGTKFEQFHETFRTLFKINLDAAVPTRVVVFKNDRAYKPSSLTLERLQRAFV